MHESVLRDFFVGEADIAALRADLEGAVTQTSYDVFRQEVIAMAVDFEITAAHLVRLCDAVLAGELGAADLSVIGFCLVASERFHWDNDTPEGRVIEATLYQWDSPEINYPLNTETVVRFRYDLLNVRRE